MRPPVEVITIGETMLRLSPPDVGERLEQSQQWDVHVGGSESNTAIGLARLGRSVRWISRLPNQPLGHRILTAIRAHGVDTSQVLWSSSEDRVGLYFYEPASPPRMGQVLYDRQHSAFAGIDPSQIQPTWFDKGPPGLLHVTGISLAVSPSAAEAIHRAVMFAKRAGWRLSFDVNYRAKLSSPAAARDACLPLLQQADVVLLPQRDAATLFGEDRAEAGSADRLRSVACFAPQAVTVMTAGVDGAYACERIDGPIVHSPALPAIGIERLGRGDAFAAGFLDGYLSKEPIEGSLRRGVAMATLKSSVIGDLPLIDRGELEQMLRSAGTATLHR
jgi:2-dehydro-3-deoxygluconokinase